MPSGEWQLFEGVRKFCDTVALDANYSLKKMSIRIKPRGGRNITARGGAQRNPWKRWPLISPVLKGHNKCAVISPFQGLSTRLTSNQGLRCAPPLAVG